MTYYSLEHILLVRKIRFFVTGDDANVANMAIYHSILHLFNKMGYSTIGCKPIASGCNKTKKGLISEDVLMLQQYSSIKLPYRLVNPISFEPAIAPHIAAKKINKNYTVNQLKNRISSVIKYKADLVLIERAGGWQVPLNDLKKHLPILHSNFMCQ
ncbi:ATP-dependent dethiobiotin synthetase BioD [Legionella anisa]|uniref:Dethiobiotin synthase n=1 Tax=Legionella anisa TaxID=28082 RepID=A0AAX0WZS8_9GAMM|nr:ATP-dependent dethiobiotin synthetase BioD [Legionella anisa]AWN74667.1 dethiobiotin synthase [Legionella anisa]KTC70129.1 dethiobiotin synthetase [Legionella anisa]MBN5937564.1 dethiobiotin synthase [Legionella anisa]MCW8426920.1 dethiobiotin synthase [Legionella anisa]MCW8449363.1 dethiobiotin synthase [Legionella anisa]